MTNKITPSQYVLIDNWLNGGSCMMSDDLVLESLALFFEVFRMPAWKKVKYIRLLQFYKFKCKFEGRTMYLTGCSRMGDIWLANKPGDEYSVRTYINFVTDWEFA